MNMNEHIAMVDFWSVCDEKGKPIGHGGKVGNEYYEYIKSDFDVIQYVNKEFLKYIANPGKTAFTHSLRYGTGKLKRVITNMCCLQEVYQKEKKSKIWFYVSDIYLFLFIMLAHKGKRKIAVNVYDEYQTNKVKNWIFRQALKKIDVVFITNTNFLKDIPWGCLIPDYAFKPDMYERYLVLEKKECAICIGTMNEKKQLREAVEVFNKNGYPLHIVGQFASKQTYKQLCEIKKDNIIIENRYVDDDEYYRLLGSSKYCLIPYDAGFYKNRTSGVIQECLFVGTVPICHEDILEFANIKGIGYQDISELENCNFNRCQEEFSELYKKERNKFYQYDSVKERVLGALENC